MKTKLKKMVEQVKEGPMRSDANVDEDEEDEFSAKEQDMGNDKEGELNNKKKKKKYDRGQVD